ncbi:MAG: tetratricopeptide repeat protein [Paludibacteraceae bacterium]|nr:tetratricopeptide repeat protein [Paludibacteraceae bacterium]
MKQHIIPTLLLLILMRASVYAEYSDHRNRHVDSLENVLSTNCQLTDDELLKIYKDLMWGYLQTDGKKSTYYARQAEQTSKKHGYLNSEADALRIQGLVAYGGNDYETALGYFNEALAVTERMRESDRYNESDIDDNLSALYGSIGNLYNMQDRLQLAITYYQKALPIFEKYGWSESLATLYHNIAELYFSMGNHAEAEKNYRLSLDAALKSNDFLLIALPNKGLGLMYSNGGNFEKAELYLNTAYAYYSAHKDLENEAYVEVINALGRRELHKLKNIARAEKYKQEALSRINDDTGAEAVAALYNFCCEIEMEKKQWQKALEYARMAVDADGEETFDDIGTYVWMTQIYTELGEKQKAKEQVVRIYNGMEQFATMHYQSGISELEVAYGTEKKQAAIEQLERERQWMLVIALLVVVMLAALLIVFILLWRIQQQRRRQDVIQAQLSGEIAERVRISRDLHDRLGGILTALKLKLTPHSETADLTEEAIQEMRNVAHHLLPNSLKRNGLKTAISDYCATFRNVHFSYTGEERHIQNEEVIYCVVYELVNNAVKSSGAQRIDVHIVSGEDYIAVNVSDNGMGMSADETASGSGINNVRERAESIGGKMYINSVSGKGTEINIEFSYDKD